MIDEKFTFPKDDLLIDLKAIRNNLKNTLNDENEITKLIIDKLKDNDKENHGILSDLTNYIKAVNDKIKTTNEFYKGISVIIKLINTPAPAGSKGKNPIIKNGSVITM